MATVIVQFSDSTQKNIVSYFASPQDSLVWQNLGEVDTSDTRWVAFYDAACTYVQKNLPSPE
jgi:hypothetical protein